MSDSATPASGSSSVDEVVSVQMREQRIPGLSLAVISGGKIVRAQGYGSTDRAGGTPVTADTLFQAASISKPVAALGALKLVEQGRLALGEDVNVKLQSWKVPENKFTAQEKVTLRRILSHSAGLTVHGFPGYASGQPVPTLVEVLNGAPPANTKPIEVDTIPGSVYRYSGGGYTVMQQLMLDVTGRPFAEWMQQSVLQPLGMNASTFASLPESLAPIAAHGHLPNGDALAGRWHIFPEMAAASLWATPSDLARFVMGIQQSLVGKTDDVLPPALTREMLTRQIGNAGLGVVLEGEGRTLRFTHSGRTPGFDSLMMGLAEFGRGVVVMLNMNIDPKVISTIMRAIVKEHWAR